MELGGDRGRMRSDGVRRRPATVLYAALGLAFSAAVAEAAGASNAPPTGLSPAERGLWRLLNEPYLARDLSDDEFERLWTIWPEPLRAQAESASPAQRRRMAFSRYGLIESPDADRKLPLGYVADGQGGWVMNCLICHGGKAAGRAIPGLGNSHFAFQTWAHDILALRAASGRKLSARERGGLLIPLGRTNGATNAQIFSVLFTTLRNPDLTMKPVADQRIPKLLHHDLDAPPFWHLKKKRRLYIDGFVEKSHRVIMQFVLLPTNSAETIRGWEEDFRDVLAYAESVEPPPYPWPIDGTLAERGRGVFQEHCASCHGVYGPGGSYPEKRVPIEEVGTDRRRLDGLPIEHRRFFKSGWMGEEGRVSIDETPDGYVAPPLDGVWASAPYFHNGAVPTLWHVLTPSQRPTVWLRSEDGYDTQRVGIEIQSFDSIPPDVKRPDERRRYFDARLPGKSAAGHDFAEPLSDDEKRALLEYLKTL